MRDDELQPVAQLFYGSAVQCSRRRGAVRADMYGQLMFAGGRAAVSLQVRATQPQMRFLPL